MVYEPGQARPGAALAQRRDFHGVLATAIVAGSADDAEAIPKVAGVGLEFQRAAGIIDALDDRFELF